MKFKKDGKVYESFEDAVNVFFLGDCKIFANGEKTEFKFPDDKRQSMIWAYEDADMGRIRLYAKLMGYEVIEDGTPYIREVFEKYGEDEKRKLTRAATLRLAKKMSEDAGISATPVQDTKAAKTTKVDMNANEYQRKAMRTATHKCYDLANAALGLTGEAGEVADIIKKHLYQGHDLYPSEVIEELGDVIWYVALMADYFNVTLGFVMQQNITKLKARYPEGFDPVKSVNREEKKE